MEKFYKVNGAPTKEKVEKYNDDEHIFFRFQNPEFEIDEEHSESWGMIFSTREEALEGAEEWGMTEEEAILPGKSCMPTLEGIWNWSSEFGKDDVVLVFEGADTRATGHDGEYVADFYEAVEVWSYEDVMKYLEEEGQN